MELRPNEGLIAVHVATDTPIERIQVSGFKVGEPFDDGSRIWFLIASPGKHKIDQLCQNWAGVDLCVILMNYNEDLTFDVEAGYINYPGLLLVEKLPVNKVGWIPINLFVVNRSAMLLDELKQAHPELIERYPIRYAGREEDRFFQALDAAQRAQETPSTAP